MPVSHKAIYMREYRKRNYVKAYYAALRQVKAQGLAMPTTAPLKTAKTVVKQQE